MSFEVKKWLAIFYNPYSTLFWRKTKFVVIRRFHLTVPVCDFLSDVHLSDLYVDAQYVRPTARAQTPCDTCDKKFAYGARNLHMARAICIWRARLAGIIWRARLAGINHVCTRLAAFGGN